MDGLYKFTGDEKTETYGVVRGITGLRRVSPWIQRGIRVYWAEREKGKQNVGRIRSSIT